LKWGNIKLITSPFKMANICFSNMILWMQ
jgi:hypothetical protein